jgi:hypothetical protein
MLKTSKTVAVAVLFLALGGQAYAVSDALILFMTGVAVGAIPWTRNHVLIPPMHKFQRLVRPMHPHDDIEKLERQAEKDQKRREREARKTRTEAQP